MYIAGSFSSYASGVWDDEAGSDCLNNGESHAMILVGYGSEMNAKGENIDYWIVQNSWGPRYGG